MTMTPLEKAIDALGGKSKLAAALGVSPQFIHRMQVRGGNISTRKVTADEWAKVTGLSKKELFPEYQD